MFFMYFSSSVKGRGSRELSRSCYDFSAPEICCLRVWMFLWTEMLWCMGRGAWHPARAPLNPCGRRAPLGTACQLLRIPGAVCSCYDDQHSAFAVDQTHVWRK